MTISLRPRTGSDTDWLLRLFGDLDTWEERNPGAPRPVPVPALARRLADGDLDGDVDFVIDDDATPVGRCGLFAEDTLARHAEVGVALLPEARGRGIGTAALELLAEFAFVRRNLRRHVRSEPPGAG